jgi:hypothetical protein
MKIKMLTGVQELFKTEKDTLKKTVDENHEQYGGLIEQV